MFIHINCEEITTLPTDHNGVIFIDESMSHQTCGWCHQMMLKRQGHGQIKILLALKH